MHLLLIQKEGGCFRASSTSVSLVPLHSTGEEKGVETGLVDKEGLWICSWNHSPESGYWFVILVYMLCESIACSFIPQCIAHVLGTKPRFAQFITLFFIYPKAELAKQH